MNWEHIPADEFILKRGGSVNPKRYPDEEFELLSIPAFDRGEPEVALGNEIGSSKSCIQPNDVLLSKIIPQTRRCWVVPAANKRRQIGSGEWIIFRGDRFEPNYLRHFLTSDLFHRQFMNTVAGVGGSLVRARPAEVGRIGIPLPPLKEQKRIATILDKADAIRRKRQQAIQLADEFLRSVFLDMFGDPVLNNLKHPLHMIGNFSRVIRGSSPRPKGDPRYYGGPVPRLMVEDLTRDGWFVTPTIDSLTIEGSTLSRPVQKGTLVMVVSGKVGVMARLNVDACIHDGFAALLDIDEELVLTDFLMILLTFMQQTHLKREAGAIFKNITTTQIKEMEVPIPHLDDQKQFVNIFKEQIKLKDKMQSLLEAETLFSSLSQRAFRGEL